MRRSLAFALVLAALAGCPARAADVSDRLTRTVPLSAGRPIRVEATSTRERIRLRILLSGADIASGVDGPEIASLRERLDALYGGEANLAFSRLDTGHAEAVLEFPHRPVPLPPSSGT